MYPGTIFNWHDNSTILIPTTSNVEDGTPLFMQVFSCDKGTEDLIEISGEDFDAMYGTMDFFRHGQSAIQAKNIIDHGGKLFAKRVVAQDSTLANTVLLAQVSEPGSDAPADAKVQIKWIADTVEGAKTYEDVLNAAKAMYDPGTATYPLIIYCDNGRGVSGKAVQVVADYVTSRTVGKTFYNLVVREGNAITERETVSFDPTLIYADNAYRFNKYSSIQITGEVIEDMYEMYLTDLADRIPEDPSVLRNYDLIFGYTNRGVAIPEIFVTPDSVDLAAETGVELTSGENGAFLDGPMTDPSALAAWTEEVVEVFANTRGDHDEVYDVDQHKIAAVIDANYPDEVKNAIFDFVTFREDCVFLRDFGLYDSTGENPLNTYIAIEARYNDFIDRRNYFCADYFTTYDIIDPNSKKTIKVTMLYDMAACLIGHIRDHANAPLAGSINDFILESAIKGTINYTPVVTPAANQKEAIDNLRVNYAIFEDNNCVVQSTYSSQMAYTQLSFIGNVVAIQEVLRAVRTACPKNRFALSTGSDLANYAQAVNDVLANYVGNFSVLNFIYTQDDLKARQKIFYASIEFAFLNWAQTEVFDIYAIND